MGGLLGDIGTIEWNRRTRGILGRGERARFTAAIVLETSKALPMLLATRKGRSGGPDPSRVTPPDTPFAKEVVEACAELGPMVIEHSYRAYIFGRALGDVDGIECDEEALFAATMFHDLAFPRMESEITDHCFTLDGAEEAERLLATSPLSEELRHDVLDAICLHINPKVAPERGAVQRLTHDGVIVDVIGLRNWELDRAGTERVFEQHPRRGFNVAGVATLHAHGKRVRGCRTAALFAAGFGPALKLSPWYPLDRSPA